ncbi:MAG: endonuclease/exonuclease/phosphatase family protein [Pseudomonadota bacterium]
MKIISLNAWGGAMYEPLSDWLAQCDADVLCLQEMTHTHGLSGWTGFADGERSLPQRASLVDDVQRHLPDHRLFFVSCDSGPVVDAQQRPYREEFGIAMCVHKRHPVVHVESVFVHGEYQRHTVWPHSGRPRAAFGVRLIDAERNRTIAITHLHGLRDSAGKGDSPERLAQAQRLAELSQRVGQGADLSVVCGDLNLLPDSETFAVLKRVGLTDLIGTADTRTSRYKKDVRHANYMLVSDVSQVIRCHAPAEPEVSDHRLVILDV